MADTYHRPREQNTPDSANGRQRGSLEEGLAEAIAPYSLDAVVAAAPAGANAVGRDASDGLVIELVETLKKTALQLTDLKWKCPIPEIRK